MTQERIALKESFGLPALHDPENELVSNSRLINSRIIDAKVAAPMAPLKYDPDVTSGTLTYVLSGEPLQVLGESANWQLVVSVIDGYLGWLDQAAVSVIDGEPTHRVHAPLAHVFSESDLKSSPKGMLPMGSYVTITGSEVKRFLPLKGGGWVFKDHIRIVGNYQNDPVSVAETFVGTPYLWGGRSRHGIDCSGLVQIALAMCGHRVHRDSGPQFRSLGRLLEEGESPMRGDLAFFPGHVGWMLDNVHMLHANATHMAVTIDTVDEVTTWVAAQTDKPPFNGYRRLTD